ncbi:type I-E CRISPR-associated protein Cse2/CasB [Scandinavium sp. NPDC088450]|uniref:type I-E CRISPR-associated protein Cse2/CasB n=1 Tax=Scandinavium sp. NPDC088450 TaxID=3364514 RepID=UPI00384F5A0F
MNTKNEARNTHHQPLIHYVFERCQQDKGFAARLRRANNPATEYQCWELLGRFGLDLEHETKRRAHALVVAAVATSRAEKNGTLTLGKAIAESFPEGSQSDQAKSRLNRLLACDTVAEVCQILRPLLSLIQSRVTVPLDYERLLSELTDFGYNKDRIRARWAQQFYASNKQEATNV